MDASKARGGIDCLNDKSVQPSAEEAMDHRLREPSARFDSENLRDKKSLRS